MLINENKVAFITAINDDDLYLECLRYVRKLEIPDGIEIEFIELRNERSLASAYNNAIKMSDAKYKVYLHQDTLIINKQFINHILRIFNVNSNIGMIGVIGSEDLNESGVYWENDSKFGKVYENHSRVMELLEFEEPTDEYQKVKAIDGLIMITQYDLNWRDDIFDGWHFYDISQCVEFANAGYDVVIPKQESAWCLHNCGLLDLGDEFNKYRKRFVDEYM